MDKAVTVVTFTTNYDIKYSLFRQMLEEAGIDYIVVNENSSTLDGVLKFSPTSIGIEIRVLEENAAEALEIWRSIK